MMDVQIPPSFEALKSNSGLFHADAVDLKECGDSELNRMLADMEAYGECRDSWHEIDQSVVDSLYSFVNSYGDLQANYKGKFAVIITDLASNMLDSVNDNLSTGKKNSIKIGLYFLQNFTQKAEHVSKIDTEEQPVKSKGKADGSKSSKQKGAKTAYDWSHWRSTCLDLFQDLLRTDPSHLWAMGIVDENFLRLMWSYALHLLEERPSGLSGTCASAHTLRSKCVSIVLDCVKLFGTGTSCGSFSSLCASLVGSVLAKDKDHMSDVVAEICAKADRRLAAEMMNELVSMNMSKVPAVKNVGTLIEGIGKVNPQLMATFLPVIKPLIDSSEHQIRSALLTAMSSVVIYIHGVCSNGTAGAAEIETAPTQKAPPSSKQKATAGEGADGGQEQAGGGESFDDGAVDADADPDMMNGTVGAEAEAVFECRNQTALANTRDSILDIIIERTHDKSPYTRATVLKIWVALLESSALPVRRVGAVAELALDRVGDKAVAVRKCAVALLTSLLDHNPFGASLDVDEFGQKEQQLQEAMVMRLEELRDMAQQSASASSSSAPSEGTEEAADVHVIPEGKEEGEEGPESADDGEEDDEVAAEEAAAAADAFLESSNVREDGELLALQMKRDFVTAALRLSSVLAEAVSRVESLLKSKNVSDVVEAIKFFTRAVNFNIKGSGKCLRSSFALVWHSDDSIKKECLTAFAQVYLTDGAEDAKPLSPEEIAQNLVNVCARCEGRESDLSSLEQIIGEIFHRKADPPSDASGDATKGADQLKTKDKEKDKECRLLGSGIDKAVAQILWAHVQDYISASRSDQAPSGQATQLSATGAAVISDGADAAPAAVRTGSTLSASLRVIAMVARFNPSVLTAAKIHLVVQTAFSAKCFAERDLAAIHAACLCLQKAAPYLTLATSTSGDVTSLKSDAQHNLVQAALMTATPALRDVLLGAMCGESEEQTRKWFRVCEEAMHTLFHIHPSPDKVFASVIGPLYHALAPSATDAVVKGAVGVSGRVDCKVARLARFMFLLGQGALNTLVYTEKVASLAKKCAASAEQGQRSAKNKDELKASGKSTAGAEAMAGADAMEEEMGLAASADADHEMAFQHLLETQLVLTNLFGKLHPLVAFVVANDRGKYAHPLLRETAPLALCRMMGVSSVLCEHYLPLMFTVLSREPSARVRASLVIALGDLAFRFPNACEPWTAHIYARLSDDDLVVRFNALTTLTHLILNDMIKVKGQVSHVVLCVSDSSSSVRNLARQFFEKLAERSSNPVYNLLGDIIANLSASAAAHPSASTAHEGTADNDVPTDGTEKIAGGKGDKDMDIISGDDSVSMATRPLLSIQTEDVMASRVLDKSQFEETMSFLLQKNFVKQDKQADSLLERLIVRMGAASTIRQKRCLSYCISQLNVTDKGVRKMVDMIKFIKDALYDDEIFNHIQAAVARAKRGTGLAAKASGGSGGGGTAAGSGADTGSSTDLRSAIDEFTQMMKSIRDDAQGNEETGIGDDEGGEGVDTDAVDHSAGGPGGGRGDPTASASQSRQKIKSEVKGSKGAAQGKKGAGKAIVRARAGAKKGRSKKPDWSDDDDEDDICTSESESEMLGSDENQNRNVTKAVMTKGGKAEAPRKEAGRRRVVGRQQCKVTDDMDEDD